MRITMRWKMWCGAQPQEMESEKAKNMSGKYYLQIGLCSNGPSASESFSPLRPFLLWCFTNLSDWPLTLSHPRIHVHKLREIKMIQGSSLLIWPLIKRFSRNNLQQIATIGPEKYKFTRWWMNAENAKGLGWICWRGTSREQAQQWIYCLYNSLTRINNNTHSLVSPVHV